MRKNKKILLGAISALSLVALGTGAVSTFAWYQTTASANITTVNNSGNTLTTETISTVDSAYELTATITFSVSGSPVQVDNDGHEWGYLDNAHSQLTDFDATTFRTGNGAPARYFTVAANPTVTLSGSSEALAAAKGKSWSGVVKVYQAADSSTVSARHALHDNTTEITGEGKNVASVHYLSTIVDGIDITVSCDGSGNVSATMSAFYVCVGGGTISWLDTQGHEGEFDSLAPVADATNQGVNQAVNGYLRCLSLSA